jgi:hypothetical protein
MELFEPVPKVESELFIIELFTIELSIVTELLTVKLSVTIELFVVELLGSVENLL